MQLQVRINKILHEYRQKLFTVLGEDLDALVLYGSQARGEATSVSDIDVLCIMKKPFNYGDLIFRTSKVTAAISLKYDVVLSRVFISRKDYETRRTPFLMNVHKEQIAV
jgi:predicted nucleotidyltransferase